METWIQFGITLITMATLFLWVRTESRADWRKSDDEMKVLRKEMIDEMKDFHCRLLILEERYLNLREGK